MSYCTATCNDGEKNGKELGVDCGGNCPQKCTIGSRCVSADDCVTGQCNATSFTCRVESQAEQCSNKHQDTHETDLNCGGSVCRSLGILCEPASETRTAQRCDEGADCTSTQCTDGLCTSCSNGVIDGDESATDCGGSTCNRCGDDLQCRTADDCLSSLSGTTGSVPLEGCGIEQ